MSDEDLREELLYRSSDYRVKPEDVPSSLMAGQISVHGRGADSIQNFKQDSIKIINDGITESAMKETPRTTAKKIVQGNVIGENLILLEDD